MNDLPDQFDGIARMLRASVLPNERVVVLTEVQALAFASLLEISAEDVRSLLRQIVPPPARIGGDLPAGVVDLEGARQRRRRLRLVAGGSAA